jgi:hypothetical protein
VKEPGYDDDGGYQCPFDHLNPSSGVVFKEMLLSQKRKDSPPAYGQVKEGMHYHKHQRMTLSEYKALKPREDIVRALRGSIAESP